MLRRKLSPIGGKRHNSPEMARTCQSVDAAEYSSTPYRSDSDTQLNHSTNSLRHLLSPRAMTQNHHHLIIMKKDEEIRRLKQQLQSVSNERDALLCEVHHLKMDLLAGELGRLGDITSNGTPIQTTIFPRGINNLCSTFSMTVDEIPSNDKEEDPVDIIGHTPGVSVDDSVNLKPVIYSSSDMTRLSSSSSSSSASSSPVLFTTSSKSPSTQFHDSSEETGDNGSIERRYGGPPAGDAALVIQRAFRRYSMVKEFQRIKTERRLSRRINNNVNVPPTPPGTNGTIHVMNNGISPVSNNTVGSKGTATVVQHSNNRQLSDAECEIIRKRLYRVGLNLFNKKPEVGISYLVNKKFLEGSASAVSRFLISRKGLSKQMIGEYLGNLQSPFSMACLEHFANEIDLSNMPIDLALRRFQTFLRMPGEAQKIERIMETFSRRYGMCNPHITAQFRNGADTVFVLAFAIIMLNTDLHTPHLKADRRMKMEDFIRNLRGIDDGADVDRDILVAIYERIKQTEFRTGSDHVTQVMKVQQTIVGKKPNLALPHRRLVCYCRLYEVGDLNKKEKSGSHQREVFLFNDIIVLTKIFHKKRNSVTYSFRQSYPLTGINLSLFTSQYYEFGMCLKRGDTVLLNLNARNEHDRAKFAEDLREAIAESDEMGRIETVSKENRDSGVDVGKIKRFSNSLLDINTDHCKPVRRGSCGSLDSGMSISFHSDENQQPYSQSQSQSSQSHSHQLQSQQSCLTTVHPPPVHYHVYHHHQGSTSSSNSSSTSTSFGTKS